MQINKIKQVFVAIIIASAVADIANAGGLDAMLDGMYVLQTLARITLKREAGLLGAV